MKHYINKPITITALRFTRGMKAYPQRIEFEGRDYEFVDAGISTRVKKGSIITRILTMTDGEKQFRLRSDNKGGIWTLLDITA